MRNALGVFQEDYYSHLPIRVKNEIFLRISPWEPVGFLEVKSQKYGHHSKTAPTPNFLTLTPFQTHPPAMYQNYHLSPTNLLLQQLLLQVSRSQLWLSEFTCFARFGGGNLLSELSSVIGLREVVGFNFPQLSLIIRMRVSTSKLFIYQCQDQSSQTRYISIYKLFSLDF